MVGRRTGKTGQKAERSRQPPLHLHHGRVQESVRSSRRKIGGGCVAPLPAKAWGSYGRSHQQKPGLSSSQTNIDTCLFPPHNVLEPSVVRGILYFIRQGRVLLIWLGMPCATFSRARRYAGLWPGPLRDSQHMWGLPYLSYKDSCKLREGNQLVHFALKLLQLCEEYNVPFVLENPLTSYVWDLPRQFSFKQHTGALYCDLDFCMYGEVWKKPTRFLYKGIDLTSLHIRCNGTYKICSRSNRPHFALSGRLPLECFGR